MRFRKGTESTSEIDRTWGHGERTDYRSIRKCFQVTTKFRILMVVMATELFIFVVQPIYLKVDSTMCKLYLNESN